MNITWLKHASHYVLPGIRKLEISDGFDDLLAIKNPGKSIVIIAANQNDENKTLNIKIGDDVILPELIANSVNIFLCR